MTPASPADSSTVTRQRVSDEEVARNLEHARSYGMNVDDAFMMSAGYPADLRDSRASETAKDAENAELKRKLEAAEAKLVNAERAGMERAAEIVDHLAKMWGGEFSCSAREIARSIRAAMSPAKDEVRG